MPQGGMAGAEQRLCSGGTTGRGVLGLGAAIVWGMGFLVRRGWLKGAEPEISAGGPARKARRRSRRDGCGRCAERRAREEGDSDLWASAGQRVTRATWAGGASVGRGGLRNGPALKRGWAGGKRESAQEKEKETGRARGAARAAEGGARELA